jgi:hypothetical protein
MQTTLDRPTTSPPTISEADAQRAAQAYLTEALGAEYAATRGAYVNGRWDLSIRCTRAGVKQPCVVGRLSIDAQTGTVIPLTSEHLREIRECAEWEAARVRGELARDAAGYVSRHQARRLARRWLDRHLAMKYGASDGLLIPLAPPVWQFSIYFSLQDVYLEPLGLIDVDAMTGDVKPLSDEQLESLRERVRAVIQHQEPAAAA